MKQAQVTDFFSASRKNVKRNLKNSSKVSPQVSVEPASLSFKSHCSSPSSRKAKLKRLPSDGAKTTAVAQKVPAFKRFCHLVPSDSSKNSESEIPSAAASTSSDWIPKTIHQGHDCNVAEKDPEAVKLSPGASALLERLANSRTNSPNGSPDKTRSPSKLRIGATLAERLASAQAKYLASSPDKPQSPSKPRPGASLLAERLAAIKDSRRPGSSAVAERLSRIQTDSPPSSPGKASPKRPAYQRYAHLVPEAPASVIASAPQLPSLPLPFAYQALLDAFKTVDNVSNMLTSRKELLSFERLQQAVQKVIRRDFSQRILGQLLRIYPESYSLRYEKNVPKFGKKTSSKFELLVDVNLKDDGTQMSYEQGSERTFNATRLVQRREKFLSNVMVLLLKRHREFLCDSLGIALRDLPCDANLKRWHPRFPLDKIEPPEPIPFPSQPQEEEERLVSAQEAVAVFRARGMGREMAACERALAKLAESRPKESSGDVALPKPEKKEKDRLRGVSQSLLEKIRAKEAAKAAELLVRGGAEWRQRQEMVSRLPDIAVHTWNLFTTTRKPALAVSFLCEKISDSHPSGLSPSAVHNHLCLLAELMPDWLELLPWTMPHARLLDMKRNLAQVRLFLTKKLEEAPPS